MMNVDAHDICGRVDDDVDVERLWRDEQVVNLQIKLYYREQKVWIYLYSSNIIIGNGNISEYRMQGYICVHMYEVRACTHILYSHDVCMTKKQYTWVGMTKKIDTQDKD